MSTESKQSFPLQWPVGYKRTTWRQSSSFKQSMDKAQRFLRDEVTRLGGTGLVVSTDLRVRTDGGLYAADMDKLIPDPGVAIYFRYKKKEISMCCDRYRRVWENIYALGKGIEALRGMERWGVSEFIDRAFTGFTALPPAAGGKPWYEVLGFKQQPISFDEVRQSYLRRARILHPDSATGDVSLFQELGRAYDEAKQIFAK